MICLQNLFWCIIYKAQPSRWHIERLMSNFSRIYLIEITRRNWWWGLWKRSEISRRLYDLCFPIYILAMFLTTRYYYKSGNIRLQFIGIHYLFILFSLFNIDKLISAIHVLIIQIIIIYMCILIKFLTILITFHFYTFVRNWVYVQEYVYILFIA